MRFLKQMNQSAPAKATAMTASRVPAIGATSKGLEDDAVEGKLARLEEMEAGGVCVKAWWEDDERDKVVVELISIRARLRSASR